MDSTLTPVQLEYQTKVREIVNAVDRQYVLDIAEDKIKYPTEFIRTLGQNGLLGIRVSKEYGGQGHFWDVQSVVSEELGVPGLIFGCAAGVSGNVVTDALYNYGSEELKKKYLPGLCSADLFAAECLTEPRGGSDFFGSVCYAKQDGDDWILNGQKRFIVGGEGADLFLTYVKTNPDADSRSSMTCFVVERGMGVKTEYVYGCMGARGGGTARVVFDNCRVPKENIVGEVHGAYPIFFQMMVPERYGTSCMTVGATRPILDIATDYTSKRKAFGQTISRFQGVSFKIADCAILLDACRGFQRHVAGVIDKEYKEKGVNSGHVRRLCTEVKKFTSESCLQVATLAMQCMGGIGYTDVYPVERIFRDIRLAPIWVGSNEVMQLIIQSEWYSERKAELKNGTNKRNTLLDAHGALDPSGGLNEAEMVYDAELVIK